MINRLLLYGVTLRRVLFVVAFSLTGAALAALLAAQSPPSYKALSTVLVASVTRADSAEVGGPNPLTETNDAQQRVLTLAQLATSNVVIERVIATTGLDQTPETLRANVTAETVPQTVLVRISAQDGDPEQAREIANVVALELEGYVQELNEQTPGSAATTSARLVDPALTPTQPVSPQPAVMLALGLIAGTAGGVILIAALARRDKYLRTESSVENVTGTPSLGSVPRVPGRRLTPISVATHQGTVQNFRSIRNNLLQTLPASTSPVVAVVSSESQEGKTSLTVGLANALASDGRAVLVIDGDPRTRGLTSILHLEDRPGWVSWSPSSTHPQEIVVKDALKSVDLVPTGSRGPLRGSRDGNTSLSPENLQNLLSRLRQNYDIILVDTADLGSYADSALISRHADGAVLIVPSGQVGPAQVVLARDFVTKAGGEVLGTVINFTARSSRN